MGFLHRINMGFLDGMANQWNVFNRKINYKWQFHGIYMDLLSPKLLQNYGKIQHAING